MSRATKFSFQRVLSVEAFQRRASDLKQLRYGGQMARFISGIYDVEVVAGGFYGLTVVGGPPKSGKSLLSLRSALDTARQGDALVLYVDLELDAWTFSQRLMSAVGARSQAEFPSWLAEHFRVLDGADAGAMDLASKLAEHVDESHDRLLIVIDSVNRLAKNQQLHDARTGYFQHLGQIVSWARRCVTLSAGNISCLLVSEVNRAGAITGQDPEYAADCFVTLQHGDNPGEVGLEFTSRSTAGFARKTYQRDGHGVQFMPLGAVREEPVRDAPPVDDDFGARQPSQWWNS